jgi:hypothetical protein
MLPSSRHSLPAPQRWRRRLVGRVLHLRRVAGVGRAAHVAASPVTMATIATLTSCKLSAAVECSEIRISTSFGSVCPFTQPMPRSAVALRPEAGGAVQCSAPPLGARMRCLPAWLTTCQETCLWLGSTLVHGRKRENTKKIFRSANDGLHPSVANLRGLQYVATERGPSGERLVVERLSSREVPSILAFLGNISTIFENCD